jgi:site-specific recombinase XerD
MGSEKGTLSLARRPEQAEERPVLQDTAPSGTDGPDRALALPRADQTLTLASLEAVDEQARQYIADAVAQNTRRAYRSDWRLFTSWCADRGLDALPAAPSTVARFLTDQAGTKTVATLHRRLSAIVQAHRAAGYPAPSDDATVRAVWRGIRRSKGTAPTKKQPLLTEDVKRLLTVLPDSLAGARDRALLLLGFAGAFRRSELVALDVADIERVPDRGALVTIRRSKTDQEGQGERIPLHTGADPATCPVRALATWLEMSGIEAGPIFRPIDRHRRLGDNRLTAQSVALIVKRTAEAAGLDPARLAGHSLRAGFATAAAIAGAELHAIMRQTRHRSATVAAGYVRDADPFRGSAGALVGL